MGASATAGAGAGVGAGAGAGARAVVRLNRTSECTSQTEPNDGCLEALSSNWLPGWYWHLRGTDVLTHADWAAVDMKMVFASAVMVTGTVVQVILCGLAVHISRSSAETRKENARRAQTRRGHVQQPHAELQPT